MEDNSMNQTLHRFGKRYAYLFMTVVISVISMNANALDLADYLNSATVSASASQLETDLTNNTDTAQVTPASATLTVTKIWVDAIVNDEVNITSSSTLTLNNTTTGNGAVDNTVDFTSTANTANKTDTDAVTYEVFAGATQTFTESFNTGVASNYTTVLACTGATDIDASDGLLIDAADTAITCTYTNTRKKAVLTVVKSWADANLNDAVSISTTGASNNVSFAATADTATEDDTDATTYDVFAGETLTFAEGFTTGAAGDYTTVLACIGATDTNASDGLLIDAADTAITCTYTNTLKNPSLAVTKVASADTALIVGQTITYTYIATNDGNVTLDDVAFTDTHGGSGTLASMTLDSTTGTDDAADLDVDTLAPTETATWTADYTVTQADVDAGVAIDNTATFTTTTPDLPVTPVTETVTPEGAAPSLAVTKVASADTTLIVGQTITYTYIATNDGNVTLDDVAFTDTHGGSGTLASMTLDSTTGTDDAADLDVDSLAPTQTATWTADYTVTQADIDAGVAIDNTATFTTTTPDLPLTPVTETVTPEVAAPSLAVTKVASADSALTVGQTITYTYTANNDGNVSLADVTFTDVHGGSAALASMTLDSTTGTDDAADLDVDSLAPTQTATWTADYTVTQADVDAGVAIDNTATFTTTTPDLPVTPVTETVTPEVAAPSLAVTKVASADSALTVGQTITYTYIATNDGNVTLDDVAFTDAHGGSGTLVSMTLDSTTGTDDAADLDVDNLAPTQTATWTADYTVTQADINAGVAIDNTATFTSTTSGLAVTEVTESITLALVIDAIDNPDVPVTPVQGVAGVTNVTNVFINLMVPMWFQRK